MESAVTCCTVDRPLLICLCGCLCAGKSTLAENIVRMGATAFLLKEDLSKHPIYGELQYGRAGWLETQLEFYVQWAQLLCSVQANPDDIVVVDHSIDVHHYVYSRVACDNHVISNWEWRVLCGAYRSFRAFTSSRFRVRNVVMRASFDTLLSRMKERSRDPGDEMHSAFIRAQRARFDSWAHCQQGALVVEEHEAALEWSRNAVLQQRIRRFLDSGAEGVN
ncbi:MAG: deoxynucleoside kinase [Terracidiphilus sp.]